MSLTKRILFILSIGIFTIPCYFFLRPLDLKEVKHTRSTRIYSSEHLFLGRISQSSDEFGEWVSFHEFPSYLNHALISIEDKRFYSHHGVDFLSLLSAVRSLLVSEGKRGGASTLTMQVARLLHPNWREHPVILRKGLEFLHAVRLEIWLQKWEILEVYLNLIPIQSNLIGFPLASQKYLQKSIRFLSKEESIAFLIFLRHPQVEKSSFLNRYKRIYKIFHTENLPSEDIILEYYEKISKNKGANLFSLTSEDGHFFQWIKSFFPNQTESFKASLSKTMQTDLYSLVNSELDSLQKWNVTNVSLIVLSLPSESEDHVELKAMIGSKNFWEPESGMVNGALAYRDAGSTIKPLLYASAIDKNLIQIYSMVSDEKLSFALEGGSSYVPRNADLKYWGDITVAEALSNSRNIPAVTVLGLYGVPTFLRQLKRMGFTHLSGAPDYYGPGLALGAGGASLFQLVRAYSIFPKKGILPKVLLGEADGKQLYFGESTSIFQKETAEEMQWILADPILRRRAFGKRSYLDFPFPVSIKTGTSKDYRNSWAIAWNESYVVGAWVGNFSGEKTLEVSGSFGAGRIVQNTFRYLHRSFPTKPYRETETKAISFCKLTGRLAEKNCPSISLHFSKKKPLPPICEFHRTAKMVKDQVGFVYPHEGQHFLFHPALPKESQEIPIKIRSYSSLEIPKCYWNKQELVPISADGEFKAPNQRGKHEITIFDGDKKIQSIRITIE